MEASILYQETFPSRQDIKEALTFYTISASVI